MANPNNHDMNQKDDNDKFAKQKDNNRPSKMVKVNENTDVQAAINGGDHGKKQKKFKKINVIKRKGFKVKKSMKKINNFRKKMKPI